jgi:hypothetical protein
MDVKRTNIGCLEGSGEDEEVALEWWSGVRDAGRAGQYLPRN